MADDHKQDQIHTDDRRRDDRQDTDGRVVVEFGDLRLAGPARNTSSTGVYFVTSSKMPVLVRIEGESEPRYAELVRLETLGSGRVGIAVRYLDRPSSDAPAQV